MAVEQTAEKSNWEVLDLKLQKDCPIDRKLTEKQGEFSELTNQPSARNI